MRSLERPSRGVCKEFSTCDSLPTPFTPHSAHTRRAHARRAHARRVVRRVPCSCNAAAVLLHPLLQLPPGLALLTKLEEAAWDCMETQFLANEAWCAMHPSPSLEPSPKPSPNASPNPKPSPSPSPNPCP